MDTHEYHNIRSTAAGGGRRELSVLKFGGTSVGSVERLQAAAGIIQSALRERRVVIVVSAASGVTDLLVEAASRPDSRADSLPDELHSRYGDLAKGALGPASLKRYTALLDRKLADLKTLLRQVSREGLTGSSYDLLISEGERLSVPLVSLMLRERGIGSIAVDASAFIRTNDRHGEADVDHSSTRELVRAWFSRLNDGDVPVVTGFIGATHRGVVTTLGRSGSDYTASLLAASLPADRLERWTDVDGIYTDDPNIHTDARRLACIVLETAQAWTSAGRLGMHRKTLDPLVAASIPVYVRSTAKPDEPGTVILPSSVDRASRAAV